MSFDLDKLFVEWRVVTPNGIPNIKNPYHLVLLKELCIKKGIDKNIVDNVILVMEKENKIDPDTIVKYKGEKGDDKESKYSYASKQPEDTPAKIAADKLKGSESEDDVDKSTSIAGDEISTDAYTDNALSSNNDDDISSAEQENKINTEVAISKLNDKRFGVEAKYKTALKKGYIGEADANNMKEFKTEMEDFLNNPNQETADTIVEKYKLSQNSNGSKLYVGIIGGNGRKILGQGNEKGTHLVNKLGDVLNEFVPLKERGDVQKAAQNALQSASKPELKTVRKAEDDPGVKKLFSNPPYNRLKGRFHQVFGPVGKDGDLLRPSSKYSTEYFKQSVNENESLDKTIQVLQDLEEQGTASPGVRTALEEHKQRMLKITENYDKLPPKKRRAIVEQSYSDMARDMHSADPDIARGLMKNMAEMALYDSELAGGDEVYLPSDGQFPSADKMRIDRDGDGVVEKVAGVSVKFGKNGAVYGFPGESTQYQKFHPDEDKRTFMRNRVGNKGHALGVRDDLIEDKTKFDKMLKESGLSDAMTNSENIRKKLLESQKEIDNLRSEIEDESGKYTKKDLVSIRERLQEVSEEAQDVLEENVDVKKLEEIMGKSNTKLFMKGGGQAVNIISMASVLNTSDGLSVLEHNHQTIDKKGLHSTTEAGTKNLKDWNFQFRAFDNRGGGLICGFVKKG